jgi:hypothetical protein
MGRTGSNTLFLSCFSLHTVGTISSFTYINISTQFNQNLEYIKFEKHIQNGNVTSSRGDGEGPRPSTGRED